MEFALGEETKFHLEKLIDPELTAKLGENWTIYRVSTQDLQPNEPSDEDVPDEEEMPYELDEELFFEFVLA